MDRVRESERERDVVEKMELEKEVSLKTGLRVTLAMSPKLTCYISTGLGQALLQIFVPLPLAHVVSFFWHAFGVRRDAVVLLVTDSVSVVTVVGHVGAGVVRHMGGTLGGVACCNLKQQSNTNNEVTSVIRLRTESLGDGNLYIKLNQKTHLVSNVLLYKI